MNRSLDIESSGDKPGAEPCWRSFGFINFQMDGEKRRRDHQRNRSTMDKTLVSLIVLIMTALTPTSSAAENIEVVREAYA